MATTKNQTLIEKRIHQSIIERYGNTPEVIDFLEKLRITPSKNGKKATITVMNQSGKSSPEVAVGENGFNDNQLGLLLQSAYGDNSPLQKTSQYGPLISQDQVARALSRFPQSPTQSSPQLMSRYIQSAPQLSQSSYSAPPQAMQSVNPSYMAQQPPTPQTMGQRPQVVAQQLMQGAQQIMREGPRNVTKIVTSIAQNTGQTVQNAARQVKQVVTNVASGKSPFAGIFESPPLTPTQFFGQKSQYDVFSGGINYGVDLPFQPGVPVNLPPGKWKVVEAYGGESGQGYIGNNANRGYGNSVLAQNLQTGDKIRISHMANVNVNPGQVIKGGRIGSTGGTGNVNGPHADVEYYNPQGQMADIMQSPYASQLFQQQQRAALTPAPQKQVNPKPLVQAKTFKPIAQPTRTAPQQNIFKPIQNIISQVKNIIPQNLVRQQVQAQSRPIQTASKPLQTPVRNFTPAASPVRPLVAQKPISKPVSRPAQRTAVQMPKAISKPIINVGSIVKGISSFIKKR